jgi:Photosynthetic reaction centre cytochrome C subunit
MQSRLFAAGVLFSSLALASPSVFGQNQAPPAQTPHARRPLPKPTNLKVLPKDIAPEELVKIMRGYAGALGVECNFCHVAVPGKRELDFASDAKDDKGIARIMIEMTHTMNEQYMTQVNDPDAMPEDKHITCGTCHRGHQMPEHFTPPEEHHAHQTAPPAGAAPQPQ